MDKRRKLRNVVSLGLELDKVDQKVLEELSRVLEDLLVNRLTVVLGPRVEFQASIELGVSETLDLSVDLILRSPAPLTPEILAEVDREIDKVIAKFEEIVLLKLSRKNES